MICSPQIRPRNASATRDAILQAARERFVRQSYDDVGVRDIAGDVGVDASLISRYFGSKEDLFGAVLDACDNGSTLWEGPRSEFGRRVADKIVYHPKEGTALQGMQIMLRSIGSARAQELVQASAAARFFGPFESWMGGQDAQIRARLASGLVLGMSVSRELGGGLGLDPAQCEQLRDRLALLLQALIDDDLCPNA